MKKLITFFTAAMMLCCAQNVGAQDERSYKSDGTGWSNIFSPLYRQSNFYTPAGISTPNEWCVRMFTNPGTGFNVMEYLGGGGQQLYVELPTAVANDANTVVRAAARWFNSLLQCNHTVVLPGGKVFVEAGGNQYEMKNTGNYQYEVIIPHAATVSVLGADVNPIAVENQDGMHESGLPSLRLQILNRNTGISQSSSQVKYIKVKFNLWANQVTCEDAVTITNNQNRCFPFGYGIDIVLTISNNAIANPFMYIEDSRTEKPNQTWSFCETNRSHYLNSTGTNSYTFRFQCSEGNYADFFGLTPFERMCIEGINVYFGYDGVTDKENAIIFPICIRHDLDIDRSGNNTITNNGAFDIIPLTENGEVNVAQTFIVRYATANPDKTDIYFRGFNGYSTMWNNYTGRPFTLVDTEEISGKTLFNNHVVQPKTVRSYEYTVTALVGLAAPFGGTETALQTYANGTTDRAAGIMTEGVGIQWSYKLIYQPILASVDITPENAQVYISSTQQFTAQAKNINDVPINTGITYSWEILEPTSCTISSTGLFTANEAGIFTVKVTAKQGAIEHFAIATMIVDTRFDVRGSYNMPDSWTTPILMNRIGLTDVYKVTIPMSAPAPAPAKDGAPNRAPAAGATYEYKIFRNNTAADGWWATPRVIKTDGSPVTFYAKDLGNGSQWLFVCDAEEIFLVGNVVGSANTTNDQDPNARLLPNYNDKFQYYIGDIYDGDYKLKVRDSHTNHYLINNDIMIDPKNIGDAGRYQISFEYETFKVTAQKLPDDLTDPWVYVDADEYTSMLSIQYELEFKGQNFGAIGEIDLGTFTNNLYLGGYIESWEMVDNSYLTVTMYYQIDELAPVGIPLYFDSNNCGAYDKNTCWKNDDLVNILDNITLPAGDHDLTIWYVLTFTGAAGNEIEYRYRYKDGEVWYDEYTATFTTSQNIITSLEENKVQQIVLFPNPATDMLYISGLNGTKEVKIVNALGKIVSVQNTNGSVNVSALTKGIYFICIDNQFVKFVKK